MAKCTPKTFMKVTPKAFEVMGGILAENELPVPKDKNTGKYKLSGTIRGSGVEVAYIFRPEKAELFIHVQKKPWIVSCDYVADKIGEFVKEAQSKAPKGSNN